MKVHGWALSAVALAAACTAGSPGPSGSVPSASTGAAGAPDTTIAPPGTTLTMVDPTDPNAAMTCMPSIAPAPVRRLRYAEYEATMTDLLGSLAPTSVTLTRDPNENGFENRANLLNPSPAPNYNLLMTSPCGDTPSGNYGSNTFGLGPAHSQLLVSIMQAFGVNRNSIGLASATGTGYMKGAPITMTGPLARLTG
jgi:hypothetical protein